MNYEPQLPDKEHAVPLVRPQKILVPTDFSTCADHAFAYALGLARQHGADVHLMHVIGALEGDAYSPLRHSPEAQVMHETPDNIAYKLLQSTIEKHDTEGIRVEAVKQHGSAVALLLLQYAKAQGIDLIVMGTHGRQGIQRFIMGSVAERVVRQAPCSVLTVREKKVAAESEAAGNPQIQRILVPVDFSEHSEALLQAAQTLALDEVAQIDLLHVIDMPLFVGIYSGLMTANDLMPELDTHARKKLGHLWEEVGRDDIPAKLHVEEGHAASHIVDFAERVGSDLIMIASQGHARVERFLIGSVAERVVRAASCPVLVLKPIATEAAMSQPHQEAV